LVEAFYQTEDRHYTMRHNNSKIKTKTNTIEDKKSHFINVKSQSERKKESKALEY